MSDTESDLDSHVVWQERPKSVLDHIFFQADSQTSHEVGQALARIVIAGLVAAGLFVFALFQPIDTVRLFPLGLVTAYLAFSVVHWWWLSRQRTEGRWRRYAVIVADLLLAGYMNFSFSVSGLGFYPIYVWIVIGNGLRFGQHYLRVATGVGIIVFVTANTLNGTVLSHTGLFVGLALGMVVMPQFFAAMVKRLAAANELLAKGKRDAERLATHDELTGLPNRRLLNARLAESIARARRYDTQLAVVFVDIDNFKLVNDSLGHHAGDTLLTEVASCLARSVSHPDLVARLSGDEFVIVLENTGGKDVVAAIGTQLFGCSGRSYRVGHQDTYVTWSCGAAVFPRDGDDGPSLVQHADTAMAEAKLAGPNQFRLYDASMSSHVLQRLRLQDDLRRAVEQRQFEVGFQPLVSLPGRATNDVEVLLRWRHPERGLLLPEAFLSAAERTGLIVPIGYQILEQALAAAAGWRRDGLGPFTLHVNLSAHQLAQADLLTQLVDRCRRYDWPTSSLGIEITESTVIDDFHSTVAVLTRLRDLGLVVSLDDFGTGFSSLDYLRKLPIDRIKIDRSFIRGIPDDAYSRTLVQAVLMFSQRLHVAVVAEGVETQSQLEWLVANDCSQMQGFLFAEALLENEFATFLHEARPMTPTA